MAAAETPRDACRYLNASTSIRLSTDAWKEFLRGLDAPDNDRLMALRQHTPCWGEERA
jgi:hypothetical protein